QYDSTYLKPKHKKFIIIITRPTILTLFPYTTLFRSRDLKNKMRGLGRASSSGGKNKQEREMVAATAYLDKAKSLYVKLMETRVRSEEHTSELQSRFDLVCRLLLEKKKDYIE